MRAIITHGLYILNPFFESKKTFFTLLITQINFRVNYKFILHQLTKTNVNVRENYLEEEEEKDANAWSPNVQQISKMEDVIVDAVTREDVVRDHPNVNASLVNLSKYLF